MLDNVLIKSKKERFMGVRGPLSTDANKTDQRRLSAANTNNYP